jgi:predicted SAM-dependent methyltransferase
MNDRLELGCGDRPTEGYLHQDIIEMSKLDFKCQPWEIPIEKNSLSEVIAIGVMEHLRFDEFRKTIEYVYNLLEPNGIFLFDIPDLKVWSGYLYDILNGKPVPFTKEHVLAIFYGWQRWIGDEHKSAWTREDVYDELISRGFSVGEGLQCIMDRNIIRNRFFRKEDAHIYIKAVK